MKMLKKILLIILALVFVIGAAAAPVFVSDYVSKGDSRRIDRVNKKKLDFSKYLKIKTDDMNIKFKLINDENYEVAEDLSEFYLPEDILLNVIDALKMYVSEHALPEELLYKIYGGEFGMENRLYSNDHYIFPVRRITVEEDGLELDMLVDDATGEIIEISFISEKPVLEIDEVWETKGAIDILYKKHKPVFLDSFGSAMGYIVADSWADFKARLEDEKIDFIGINVDLENRMQMYFCYISQLRTSNNMLVREIATTHGFDIRVVSSENRVNYEELILSDSEPVETETKN